MGTTLRVRAAALAIAAGFVDAVGFLTMFGLFTAHMSGNTTHLGVDLGARGVDRDAVARIIVLVTFVVAVGVGAAVVMSPTGSRARNRGLFAAEGLVLTAVMLMGSVWQDTRALRPGATPLYVLAMLTAFAMGLQNASLRRVAGTEFSTTFVTGVLTHLAEDTVRWLRDRSAIDARRRITLNGGIWMAYLIGGIAGAAAETDWHFWALAAPIGVVILVAMSEPRERAP